MSTWLARFSLVAALVLSQALYAAHGADHVTSDRADCQICLQASSGGAVLSCGQIGPLIPVFVTFPLPGYVLPAASSSVADCHGARAPPFSPV